LSFPSREGAGLSIKGKVGKPEVVEILKASQGSFEDIL
jgi:hypothetical protein